MPADTQASDMIAPPPQERSLMIVPFVIAIAFLMEQLDSTVVISAIPAISASMGVTPLRLNLAVTSYVLSLAVFIPISGWVADRFGARRVFLFAIVVFTLGSIACGLSNSFGLLISARMIQGVGGALMTPVGRLILLRSFRRDQIVAAISYMTMPLLIGPMLGPVIGGFLTVYATWRWIFFINVPICLLGLAATWRFIDDIKPIQVQRFDITGFLLCAGSLALLQLGLENLVHPVVPALAGGLTFAFAALLMAAYVLYARSRTAPALELSLLRLRAFRVGVMWGGLARIGLNAVPFLLQLQLQLGFGYSPLQSGGLVFISAVGALIMKPVTTGLLRRVGFRSALLTTALFGGAMTAGFALVTAQTSLWLLAPYLFCFGILRSLHFNGVNSLAYAEIPRERQSAAVGVASVGQQVSMGLGVSLSAGAIGLLIGDATPDSTTISHIFAIMGATPLLAMIGFLTLQPQDGQEASGHRNAS